jgi:hypothetical protein
MRVEKFLSGLTPGEEAQIAANEALVPKPQPPFFDVVDMDRDALDSEPIYYAFQQLPQFVAVAEVFPAQ